MLAIYLIITEATVHHKSNLLVVVLALCFDLNCPVNFRINFISYIGSSFPKYFHHFNRYFSLVIIPFVGVHNSLHSKANQEYLLNWSSINNSRYYRLCHNSLSYPLRAMVSGPQPIHSFSSLPSSKLLSFKLFQCLQAHLLNLFFVFSNKSCLISTRQSCISFHVPYLSC